MQYMFAEDLNFFFFFLWRMLVMAWTLLHASTVKIEKLLLGSDSASTTKPGGSPHWLFQPRFLWSNMTTLLSSQDLFVFVLL